MAWLDPYDQIVYRVPVGRLLYPITAAIDQDHVLSSRIRGRPPRWQLENWKPANRERRARALLLLDDYVVMGAFDIRNYYPGVTRKSLETAFGNLPLHVPTFRYLLDWLDSLSCVSQIRGLPIGHEPSAVLANGLLAPADSLLSDTLGVEFLRWVDGTWLFLHRAIAFDQIRMSYAEVLQGLDLKLHPEKTRSMYRDEARERGEFRNCICPGA